VNDNLQNRNCGSYIYYIKTVKILYKHLTNSITYVIIALGDKMNITKGRGYVYSIQYHVVWCVKYRHKVLTDEIENTLIEILNKIATDNNFRILECNGNKDHIHLLIDYSPQHYIPDMIKALKGVSARLLMKQYGEELKRKLWGGHLWNPSYFIATVSENTEEQIRKYIQSQKVK
jgi:putative transposase